MRSPHPLSGHGAAGAAAGAAGVARNEIRDHFGRNKSAAEINALLAPLISDGRVTETKDSAGHGRPTTRYRA